MNIDCRTRGCVYEIKCEECEVRYIGQTGRSLFERMNEHFAAWKDKREKAVLWEHSKTHHRNGDFDIKVAIKARCFGEPTTRLITEAVLINELEDQDTLNNKNEWSYVRLPNIAII